MNDGKVEFSEQELFVFNHLKTVVQFHLEKDLAEKGRLTQRVWKNEEEGHRVGLNQEQIGCLNFLILEEKQNRQHHLEDLLQKLEAKMDQVK
ncbi:MAG: hypothetical protein Q8M00_00445 [bacterium]|nr:hypothetical protein [bacterium]